MLCQLYWMKGFYKIDLKLTILLCVSVFANFLHTMPMRCDTPTPMWTSILHAREKEYNGNIPFTIAHDDTRLNRYDEPSRS